MVKVKKQTVKKVVKKKGAVKKKASRGDSVLDRIAPVGSTSPAIRMTIYGRGKTGKTRLFSTYPTPSLLIGTEDGTRSVSNVQGMDYVRIYNSGELEPLLEKLKEGKYKSVCIDHAGNLQDMVLQEVLGLEDMPVQKDWGMAKQQDWATCGMQTKEHLRSVLNLAETHDINVAIIAHERNFKDDGAGDLIIPTVGAALSPSTANWLNGACDYIVQTFIREQTEKVVMKAPGKKSSTRERLTGRKEFCLRIGPHPIYMTGFRLPPGIELPDEIVDPTFSKIMKLIEG